MNVVLYIRMKENYTTKEGANTVGRTIEGGA